MSTLFNQIPVHWKNHLKDFEHLIDQIERRLDQEFFQNITIFPARENIFRALCLAEASRVRVLLLGQDPYPGQMQANGLAFAVNRGVPLPGSLRNIFREIRSDIGSLETESDLLHWAKQGVMLLNTVLTVREGKTNSHADLGWKVFTEEIIRIVCRESPVCVFLLLGRQAQSYSALIEDSANGKYLIVEAAHPSPLSAYSGFFGSKVFSKINNFLSSNSQEPIKF